MGVDQDILYMLGMMNGPYGSHATPYKIGKQIAVRVEENEENSGLVIEYWPAFGMAFAKMKRGHCGDHVPKSLARSFAGAQADERIRVVYADLDKENENYTYDGHFIDQVRYNELVEEMSLQETCCSKLAEEGNRKYHRSYLLPPMSSGESEGEGLFEPIEEITSVTFEKAVDILREMRI
jgi:hypothetical protein